MSHPLLFLLAAMPALMDLSCLSILRVVLGNVEKFSAALPTLTLESFSLSTLHIIAQTAIAITLKKLCRDCVNLVGGDFTLTLALSLRERG